MSKQKKKLRRYEKPKIVKLTKMTFPVDIIEASGNGLSISNNFNSREASFTGADASAMTWKMAVPPNAPIHKIDTSVGITMTQNTNSRMVRPFETRAINMPTKGDQEIHQAQ